MQPQLPLIEWIRPTNVEDWSAYQHFRWAMLRAPWLPDQQPEMSMPDHDTAEHCIARNRNGDIVACGQLLWLGQGQARLRSMAVAEAQRGCGLGRQLVTRLEGLARGRGCEQIIAQARDSALGFYQAMGYRSTRPGETLFGKIPHSWVEKHLSCDDFSHFGLTLDAASDADGPALSDFIFGILAEYGLQPEHDGIDQDLLAPATTYRDGLFDILRDAQGKIVATVALLPTAEGEAELRRMYLAGDQRGKGLGRACLGYALQQARRRRLHTLHLETATVLREALGLYAWAGFRPLGGSLHAQRCDQSLVLKDF